MGELKQIYIASRPGGTMQAVDMADAIEGSGIEGDRYAAIRRKAPGGQVTLIQLEHILAFNGRPGYRSRRKIPAGTW